MSRSISTYPFRGAACPKLKEVVSCNLQQCPIDCKLADWNGWSKCSADCGGGVSERNRDVLQEALHGGEGCGATEESTSCNLQSCDKDCVLSEWTRWSRCSKPCNRGLRTRQKIVVTPTVGAGSCPSVSARNQQQTCRRWRCPSRPIRCRVKSDTVLVIDGSGSIRNKGWRMSKRAGKHIIKSMNLKESKSKMALLVYSGPRGYCNYYRCIGYSRSWAYRRWCWRARGRPYCGVDTLSHLTSNTNLLLKKLRKAKFPRRGTYTKHALYAAKTELTRGRKNAKSTVIVMTDGHPADRAGTYYASKSVKKVARLVYVPVTRYAPLKYIKSWASGPDAIVPVTRWWHFYRLRTINNIVASGCNKISIVYRRRRRRRFWR